MPSDDHTLNFTTFLKLLELPENQKRTMLKGFTSPGGYDYWRPLKRFAEDVAKLKITGAQITDNVSGFCKGHQLKYNDEALTKLSRWFEMRKAKVISNPGEHVTKLGNSGMKVRLAPEVAFEMERVQYVMHIWATNTPSLSDRTLSTGLFFFRDRFIKAGHDGFQYLIYDTVKGRVFGEFDILSNANAELQMQQTSIHALWKEVWAQKGDQSSDGTSLPSDGPGLH